MKGWITATILLFLYIPPGVTRPGEYPSFLSTNRIELENVEKGKTVETEITVTNPTDRPLLIVSVRVPCTCIKVRWPKKPILPGESERVWVRFQAKDRGAFYKDIQIKYNTRTEPESINVVGFVE